MSAIGRQAKLNALTILVRLFFRIEDYPLDALKIEKGLTAEKQNGYPFSLPRFFHKKVNGLPARF